MEKIISLLNKIRSLGIARLYFVAWVDGEFQGSFLYTHTSWMPDPAGAYQNARQYIRGKRGAHAVKKFHRVF